MLPKLDKPQFTMTVPSQNRSVDFRPFLVKEEKILLLAQQAEDDKDIVKALTQILNNCITTPDFDVTRLTTFDLEYMFLKLRAKSVNNIVELRYQDVEDEKIYTVKVDLDEVEIIRTPEHTNKIEITETIGIIMKYPSVTIADGIPDGADQLQIMDYLIKSCIDKIYDAETVYSTLDVSDEELTAFLDDLDVQTYDKIRQFFQTMPRMAHEISYTNSNGAVRTIELSGIRDFFTWG